MRLYFRPGLWSEADGACVWTRVTTGPKRGLRADCIILAVICASMWIHRCLWNLEFEIQRIWREIVYREMQSLLPSFALWLWKGIIRMLCKTWVNRMHWLPSLACVRPTDMAVLWAQSPRAALPPDRGVSTAMMLRDVLAQAQLPTPRAVRSSYKEADSHYGFLAVKHAELNEFSSPWGHLGWGCAGELPLSLFAFLRMMSTLFYVSNALFLSCLVIAPGELRMRFALSSLHYYTFFYGRSPGAGGGACKLVYMVFL